MLQIHGDDPVHCATQSVVHPCLIHLALFIDHRVRQEGPQGSNLHQEDLFYLQEVMHALDIMVWRSQRQRRQPRFHTPGQTRPPSPDGEYGSAMAREFADPLVIAQISHMLFLVALLCGNTNAANRLLRSASDTVVLKRSASNL